VRDALVERAVEAAARLAEHFHNEPDAERAWAAVFSLKRLRRAEVTERMDRERMEKVSRA